MEKAQQQSGENINKLSNNQEEGEIKKKKRRRQKKGKKTSVEVDSSNDQDINEVHVKAVDDDDAEGTGKKHRRKKNKTGNTSDLPNGEIKKDAMPANVYNKNISSEGVKEKIAHKKQKIKHSHNDGSKKRRKKLSGVEGVSAARLASYGI